MTTPLANTRPLIDIDCAAAISITPACRAIAETSSKPVAVCVKLSAKTVMRPICAAWLPPSGKLFAAEIAPLF